MKSSSNKDDIYNVIYEVVRHVPKGRVTSYGAIAAAIGLRSGARLVGYAMNLAHNITPKVPAHRVVNSAGLLTGKFHFATIDRMQQLLEKEGITIKNDKVVDFQNLFWNPMEEIMGIE
jgi:methylated-DNA-protein-cysteine methyltransferase related protein